MDDQEMLTLALLALLGAPTVELDGAPYVVLRPLATALGLDWPTTCVDLSDNGGCLHLAVVRRKLPGEAKVRPLICLHSYDVPEWLARVDPSQVRPEMADRVRQFQAKYTRALDEDLEHWTDARPVEMSRCERIVQTPEEREAEIIEQGRRVEARRKKRARLIKEAAASDYQDEAKLAKLVAMGVWPW